MDVLTPEEQRALQATDISNAIDEDGRGARVDSNFTSLRFPQELGTAEVPAWIRFEPIEYEYGTLSGYGTEITNNNKNSVFQNSGPISGYSAFGNNLFNTDNNGLFSRTFSKQLGPLNLTINNPLSGVVNTLSKQAEAAFSELTNKLASAQITFGNSVVSGRVNIADHFKLSQGLKVTETKSFGQGSINLFLPHSLATKTKAAYDPIVMGPAAGMAVDSVRNLMSDAIDGEAISNALQAAIGGAIADVASRGKIRGGLAIVEGLVANNFKYQIFNEVEHRKFDYEFNLIAKNAAETEEIYRICNMFLYYMLPTRIDSSAFSFFEVPSAFKIRYKYGEDDLKYHLQPNECFLTNVDVSYGKESGNALYNNTAPLEVNLKLSFTEIEPLYRSKE